MFPLTVTRLVRDAPLPVVGPVTVVKDGMFSVPEPSNVMVVAAENLVASNVMLPEPRLAASSSASRRLHDGSVPVPGVVWMVQLEAVPASSSTLVTTRFGLVTEIGPDMPVMLAVTVSVAVMDWLPGVASVALKVPAPLMSVLLAGNVAPASVLEKATVPA